MIEKVMQKNFIIGCDLDLFKSAISVTPERLRFPILSLLENHIRGKIDLLKSVLPSSFSDEQILDMYLDKYSKK